MTSQAASCLTCVARLHPLLPKLGLQWLRMQQHTETGCFMQTAVLDDMKATMEERNTSKHEIDARRKQAVSAKNAAARKFDKRKAVRSECGSRA